MQTLNTLSRDCADSLSDFPIARVLNEQQQLACYLVIHQLSKLSNQAQLDYLNAFHQIDSRSKLLQSCQQHKLAAKAIDAINTIIHCQSSAISERIHQQIDWMHNNQVRLCVHGENFYPSSLKTLPQPPAFLYLKGHHQLIHMPQIAIVGARKATPTGVKTATAFAKVLANKSLVITSGMALGIDAAAHQSALKNNSPTIAILGTGIDQVYPKNHQSLYETISDNGLLVSEFCFGAQPRRYHFPQRNRMISGLSLGVLVVEANERSGSLTTARAALEQGREVFAVPGSIYNPLSKGCHWLIQQGATLVQSADEIIEHLSDLGMMQWQIDETKKQLDVGLNDDLNDTHSVPENQNKTENKTDKDENLILSLIEDQGTSIDDLLEATDWEQEAIINVLLELERQQRVKSVCGSYFRS